MTETNRVGGTDIAALAGAVVAVSVTTFTASGPYTFFNLALSATLLALIFGYVWPTVRSKMQSVALAAVMGIVTIQGIGFFFEAYHSNDTVGYLTLKDWCPEPIPQGKKEPIPQDKKKCEESNVTPRETALSWWLVVLLTLLLDHEFQTALRARPDPDGIIKQAP